jgi:hypothetical protein
VQGREGMCHVDKCNKKQKKWTGYNFFLIRHFPKTFYEKFHTNYCDTHVCKFKVNDYFNKFHCEMKCVDNNKCDKHTCSSDNCINMVKYLSTMHGIECGDYCDKHSCNIWNETNCLIKKSGNNSDNSSSSSSSYCELHTCNSDNCYKICKESNHEYATYGHIKSNPNIRYHKY